MRADPLRRCLREAAVDAAAVDAEEAGGLGDVAAGLFEGALDERLFCFIEIQGQLGRGCRDRAQLVMLAYESGVIVPGAPN